MRQNGTCSIAGNQLKSSVILGHGDAQSNLAWHIEHRFPTLAGIVSRRLTNSQEETMPILNVTPEFSMALTTQRKQRLTVEGWPSICSSGSSCLTMETLPSSVLQKIRRWGLICPPEGPTKPASSKAPRTVASPTSSTTCVIKKTFAFFASSRRMGAVSCRTLAASCNTHKQLWV